jgi:hypothetical protein
MTHSDGLEQSGFISHGEWLAEALHSGSHFSKIQGPFQAFLVLCPILMASNNQVLLAMASG